MQAAAGWLRCTERALVPPCSCGAPRAPHSRAEPARPWHPARARLRRHLSCQFGLEYRLFAEKAPIPLFFPTTYTGDYVLTFQARCLRRAPLGLCAPLPWSAGGRAPPRSGHGGCSGAAQR